MSYVSVDAPLPQNSMDPPTACQVAHNRRVVETVETAVNKAKAASAMIATPLSFSEFGNGVVRDAARGQKELIAGNTLTVQPHRNGSAAALAGAPTQVPLNVTTEEYAGCKIRGITALLPVPMPKNAQRVIMPAPAPTDTGLLTTGNQLPSSFGFAPEPSRPMNRMSIAPRGMRGLGVVWGDAIADQPIDGGMTGKSLLLLALAGLGLYAATRGKR